MRGLFPPWEVVLLVHYGYRVPPGRCITEMYDGPAGAPVYVEELDCESPDGPVR